MLADSNDTGTVPSASRNASGNILGASVASVLDPQAAKTPSVNSENIPGRPRRSPAIPPERIGQPPQNTIGVASAN